VKGALNIENAIRTYIFSTFYGFNNMSKKFTQLFICTGIIATIFSSSVAMADSIILTLKATGHKYQLIDKQLTWTAARDYCKNTVTPTGGYLVTITSQSENDFIYNNFLSTTGHWSWLGASDAQEQGSWNWVTTAEKFNYVNWSDGEPHIANGLYIIASNNGHWSIDNDTTVAHFICEWGGSAYKDYVDSAFLNDMNANNSPEIATLYTDLATGQVTVKIEDSNTKAVISTLKFGVANKSFPKSIAVFSSTTGTQDIAVLLIDNITLKATQEIRDAATGKLISSVPL
jgi:hypothetical protein